MKPKALVVESNPKTVQLIDDILAALDHEYDAAPSLVDARKLLRANGYSYSLLDAEIPARLGGIPRIINAENFLDVQRKLKGRDMPPTIVMLPPENTHPEMTRGQAVRMAHGLMHKGTTDFIEQPLATAGRTLDRVIKKVLGLLDNNPIDPAKSRSPACRAGVNMAGDNSRNDSDEWLTVTDAAELLMHDVPGLDLLKARSRISTAASRKEFKFSGCRKDRRIEPNNFAVWRLKQRDRDLDEEDDGQEA